MKIGIKGLLAGLLGVLCLSHDVSAGRARTGGERQITVNNSTGQEIVARFEFQGRVGTGYCSGVWRGSRSFRNDAGHIVTRAVDADTSCVNLLSHLTVWVNEPEGTKILTYRHRDPSRRSRRTYNVNIVDGHYVIQSEGNESNRVPVGTPFQTSKAKVGGKKGV